MFGDHLDGGHPPGYKCVVVCEKQEAQLRPSQVTVPAHPSRNYTLGWAMSRASPHPIPARPVRRAFIRFRVR